MKELSEVVVGAGFAGTVVVLTGSFMFFSNKLNKWFTKRMVYEEEKNDPQLYLFPEYYAQKPRFF